MNWLRIKSRVRWALMSNKQRQAENERRCRQFREEFDFCRMPATRPPGCYVAIEFAAPTLVRQVGAPDETDPK